MRSIDVESAYDKNIHLKMGRCPVRSIFPQALEMLKRIQGKLAFMTENIMGLTDAVIAYERFNKMEVQKVIFDVER